MSDNSGFYNDLIMQNRDLYYKPPVPETQKLQKSIDDSIGTISGLITQNQQQYLNQYGADEMIPEQNEEDEIQLSTDLLEEVFQQIKIPEMVDLRILYNYRTIVKGEGILLEETKRLDKSRRQRKERNQKESGNQEEILEQKEQNEKKKYERIYKIFLSRLHFEPPKTLKLISYNLKTEDKWIKPLNIADFGYKCPSLSVVQEKATGRFYIYDNSCGKIHIFSSDMFINPAKDKPLVSLYMNEEVPRQNPLLYLMECEHEYQWKSVLFVIGGYHTQRGIKRPLRTIKVFEIKRREVTLTPTMTITMKYPRLHPIIFTLSRSDQNWEGQESKVSAEHSKPIEEKYLFIIGGNPLSEYLKDQLDQELKEANQTCEYVQFKLILEHITRAKQFISVEQNQQVSLGTNFGEFTLNDSLNINYYTDTVPEKIYYNLHHASVVKFRDEVLQQTQQLLIIGGNSQKILQLKGVTATTISLQDQQLQLPKPTKIWSTSNIKYLNKICYFDEASQVPIKIAQGGRAISGKTSCTCQIM